VTGHCNPPSEISGQSVLHVAIDGPSGAGKSTVGRGLARMLGIRFLDTGLMYRALARRAVECGVDLDDGSALAALAASMRYALAPHDAGIIVDGRRLDAQLRTPDIDRVVSRVAAHPAVRAIIVGQQREFARGTSMVMVGRDIGTVVLPHAIKVWLTASSGERARRRSDERVEHDGASALTLAQLQARDTYDSTRAASPLRKADDAITVDTDGLSIDEAIQATAQAVLAAAAHQP
jgi:CMP/dCMP kinase